MSRNVWQYKAWLVTMGRPARRLGGRQLHTSASHERKISKVTLRRKLRVLVKGKVPPIKGRKWYTARRQLYNHRG